MPRKSGSRRDRAEKRRLQRQADNAARGIVANDVPNLRILRLREMFSFVTPSKGPEGRVGSIDQDVCDPIGQLHACGLLNGHGHDATDLRDIAREWRNGYVLLMKGSACKAMPWERSDKGHQETFYSGRDARWDRLDMALTGFEREVLTNLLVDPEIGVFPDGNACPWASALIAEVQLKRGIIPDFMRFPDSNDHALFDAALRGLFLLMDAGIAGRRQRAA